MDLDDGVCKEEKYSIFQQIQYIVGVAIETVKWNLNLGTRAELPWLAYT